MKFLIIVYSVYLTLERSIPATLIARFILNLQKIAAERTHVPTSDMTLSFAPNRLNNNTELWIDLEPL